MMRLPGARWFSIALLMVLFGLIGARLPAMSGLPQTFSWHGFALGAALVLVAFFLSRPFAGRAGASEPGTRAQRGALYSALVCFFSALVSVTALMYFEWDWLVVAVALAVVGGVLAVAAGMVLLAAGGHDA